MRCAHIFPRARLSAHDGELIAELAKGPSPTVILMNPPFARSRERGVDGRTAMRHLRSALRICASGGRLVAILPDGFDASAFVEDQEQASLLLNIRLSGAFSRSGTGIAVRMVVIEKAALQDASTIAEDLADLAELHSCLAKLPDRAPRQPNIHRLPVRSVATSADGAASRKPIAPFVTGAAQKSAAVALDYQALARARARSRTGRYLPALPTEPRHHAGCCRSPDTARRIGCDGLGRGTGARRCAPCFLRTGRRANCYRRHSAKH